MSICFSPVYSFCQQNIWLTEHIWHIFLKDRNSNDKELHYYYYYLNIIRVVGIEMGGDKMAFDLWVHEQKNVQIGVIQDVCVFCYLHYISLQTKGVLRLIHCLSVPHRKPISIRAQWQPSSSTVYRRSHITHSRKLYCSKTTATALMVQEILAF